jgi:hypothetical protein
MLPYKYLVTTGAIKSDGYQEMICTRVDENETPPLAEARTYIGIHGIATLGLIRNLYVLAADFAADASQPGFSVEIKPGTAVYSMCEILWNSKEIFV